MKLLVYLQFLCITFVLASLLVPTTNVVDAKRKKHKHKNKRPHGGKNDPPSNHDWGGDVLEPDCVNNKEGDVLEPDCVDSTGGDVLEPDCVDSTSSRHDDDCVDGIALPGDEGILSTRVNVTALSFQSVPGEYTPGVVMASTTNANTTTSGSGGGSFSWSLKTGKARKLTGVQKDPADSQASMRGGGSISIAADGMMTMVGSPRYYVSAPNPVFLNVEMISYGRIPAKKKFGDFAGMTMVTRSNHGSFEKHPCQAMGYYSRIYFNTGEFAFQKEFYHNYDSKTTIYSKSRRKKIFDSGFPVGKWVGMKYVLTTNSDGKSVSFKGYVDLTEGANGGDWKLAFETVDKGGWPAASTVPSECKVKDDEVILRPGRDSYFRTDGVDTFEWKEMSIKTL